MLNSSMNFMQVTVMAKV